MKNPSPESHTSTNTSTQGKFGSHFFFFPPDGFSVHMISDQGAANLNKCQDTEDKRPKDTNDCAQVRCNLLVTVMMFPQLIPDHCLGNAEQQEALDSSRCLRAKEHEAATTVADITTSPAQ
jgi:hypothetical protein